MTHDGLSLRQVWWLYLSRFGFIMRTDRQSHTHRQTRLSVLLTRLSSAWVNIYVGAILHNPIWMVLLAICLGCIYMSSSVCCYTVLSAVSLLRVRPGPHRPLTALSLSLSLSLYLNLLLSPVLWTVDHTSSTTCRTFPLFTSVPNYTAWWQKHMAANDLPFEKFSRSINLPVQKSNQRPFNRQYDVPQLRFHAILILC